MSAVQEAPGSGPVCVHGPFLGAHHDRNERRTWIVVGVTAAMMVGEIAGGALYGSMALLADGWHMATHAAAMAIAAMAYRFARVHAHDSRFVFGTGKVGELAAFASAVALGAAALMIGWESLLRLISPRAIHFEQAIAIAVLGLVVNVVSAMLLYQSDHGHDHGHAHKAHDDAPDHDHEHDHDHGHENRRHHHDNNLRAAYLHVMADALTSVAAIVALAAGRYLGWTFLDPVIGIAGAVVIAHWSVGLVRSAAASLLDMGNDPRLVKRIRAKLESDADRVCDLHLWRLAPGHQALMVSITSDAPLSPAAYKARLAGIRGLSHVTVEVNPSAG
jgi:cation diffusion facilitator family transporter